MKFTAKNVVIAQSLHQYRSQSNHEPLNKVQLLGTKSKLLIPIRVACWYQSNLLAPRTICWYLGQSVGMKDNGTLNES